ncbi:MAG: LytTR family DNA-binding domain-containing protein [Cytophagales bacterium]|nr:LytTR family DNA-binding domain-containing protein [Cytophagales bacterium]
MNVLIIEDEIPAAEKIERYLLKYDSNIKILGKLQSVEESVAWLQENDQSLDLIFSDIQLTDGLSFEIFQKHPVNIPVIFATAYDEYALDAFKLNSIDYLLKPVTFMDLSNAINKLKTVKEEFGDTSEKVKKVVQDAETRKYKARFMVKLGEHIHSIQTEDASIFFAEGRTAYLVTNASKKFIVDFKLEDLENLLNPETFFRVNRTFILNIHAIKDVLVYSNSRLKITPKIEFDQEIIVSRERVAAFKDWFGGT